MAQNLTGKKFEGDGSPPTEPAQRVEHSITAEDDYRNTTPATRRKIFSNLQAEKARLETQKADLSRQLDLAKRRLEAYNLMESAPNPPPSDPCSWLSRPKDIAKMRDRLKEASENEQLILSIVQEVRDVRERLLEQALMIYRDLGGDSERK